VVEDVVSDACFEPWRYQDGRNADSVLREGELPGVAVGRYRVGWIDVIEEATMFVIQND